MNALPTDSRATELRTALERLDLLLRRAVAAANRAHASRAGHPYPGLCVTDEEVDKLLLREPMQPSLWGTLNEDGLRGELSGEAAGALRDMLDLSDFELDVVLISLAPELDLKYERLFAYLNDDLTKKWPTVDLALNILCSSSAERLQRYRHFTSSSRLYSWGLLEFRAAAEGDDALLSRRLRIEPIVVRFLCGEQGLDEPLRGFCTHIVPSWSLRGLPIEGNTIRLLSRAVAHAKAGESVRVRLIGPPDCGQAECAEGLASALGAKLLVADLSRIPDQERHKALSRVLLQARLFGEVPYFQGTGSHADGRICELIAMYPGIIVSDAPAGSDDDQGFVATVELQRPTSDQRHAYWNRYLGSGAPANGAAGTDMLATLFELSFAQIRAAVSDVQRATRMTGGTPNIEDLMDSARRHSSHELAAKAEHIATQRSWVDLVLPDDAAAQLHELCDRIRRRRRVLERWGFGRERRGTGVNALFVGASGTGKTLAAEVVAADLGLNLYRIDLAIVVSKYVGETEKNLDSIFRGAERSNAVLLFDEADALFGKRSVVRDAHDRYANVEIAYLLQRLESYPGVAILTTNLSDNLDPAFARRLAYTVHFPFPGPSERQRIWETVWPPEAPLASDVQLGWLAARFKLTGGNIRNIALAAACLVDDEGGVIAMTHILHALRREFHKMGKALAARDLAYSATDSRVAAS